ncbi:MAG: hypothetical protein A2Y34_09405, partial [Spirochaetes bacterium GWC1_27_15]
MVESSSIISSFKFISYKVDNFKFEMAKHVSLLGFSGNTKSDDWEINLSINQPTYLKKNNLYIGSINCKIVLLSDNNPVVNLETSISGLFQSDCQLDKTVEENLVKYQIPTILFPYLRSTVTNFIANSGFGSFIFPLINVVELSKKTL